MPDAIVIRDVIQTQTLTVGLQGPTGPQGPIGPPGDAMAITAAITLSGHRVIAADAAGAGIYADASTIAALAVQGLSLHAGIAGDTIVLARSGTLSWPAANLTPGAPLFLAGFGLLTETPPTSGWLRQIAVAIDADTLSIDIGPAYWLGD